ncbi:MAG: inorganic diphosphatase [Firmicutes bacterium]|nr:inorganic diphosphatase [Bacillota bacterium]MDD4262925.1 inorganic diphosphatase [Bacillota bacterium]MDD4693457.1 inorganic diphosphatase [Bacillota bacterium]
MLVDAFVEIPKGSQNKYEFDVKKGQFVLDRVLYGSIHYPGEYGFIPGTLAEDGDPLDILVLSNVPTFPGCIVEARVLGALEMADDKGRDVKILAALNKDPRYDELQSLSNVPNHILKEIEHFFRIYKQLEGKETAVDGWRDLDFALREIEQSKISS